MNEGPPSRALIRFGGFELDTDSRELREQGVKVRLQEQPFQILQVLLEQPGRVVTREELQQRIWSSDTFVDFDSGLYNAIKKLRDALGDSAESPRFIETLSRRGYRFIADVEKNGHAIDSDSATLEAIKPPPSRNPRLGIALGLAAVVLSGALLGGVKLWQRFSRGVPRIHSLAVLPLRNLSSDPNQEYFADGLTDELITDLAQISSIKVISHTSTMQYKDTRKALPEIARELNVDGIVEGTVQRSGDQVRITAQLIHGPSDEHLWASSYERDARDIFVLERSVTEDITRQVQARIAQDRPLSAQPRPVNVEALEAYLRGKFHLDKAGAGPRDEELRKASSYFQRAIDTDPTFVAAYIGLAEAHNNLFWPSSEDFAIRQASAAKALELAPGSSDAHLAVAKVKADDWDWAGAEEEYKRAIALNPNSASSHEQLGRALDSIGRMDEGWKEQEMAQELDPNQDHLSDALYMRGQDDRAIELLQRTAESLPEDATTHWALSENYLRKGMYREWVQEWSEAITLSGLPEGAARVRQAFDQSGSQGAMLQVAEEMERLVANKQGYFPAALAEIYTTSGDKGRAFYWLGQACEHRRMASSDPVLMEIKVEPGLAPLHSDPRFKDVLRCMGLPP